MIYFDNAASTRVDKVVLESMMACINKDYANPSSVHRLGRNAHKIILNAKEFISKTFNAPNKNIFFTQSASECNNIAIRTMLYSNKEKGKHIVCSNIEHASVLKQVDYLSKNGYSVSYVKANKYGIIEPDTLRTYIKDDTSLVIVMHVNNEIGSINDIQSLSAIAHDNGAVFYTDTVQAVGHCNIDFINMGIDGMCISAHKIYGPKGIACLILNNNIIYEPFIFGGGQQGNFISGTENIAGIVAMTKSIEIINSEMRQNNIFIAKLKQRLLYNLDCSGINYETIIPLNFSTSHIICIRLFNIINSVLINRLDMEGFCVSAGSACSSGAIEENKIVFAITDDINKAKESIRISFSKYNTMDEVDKLSNALIRIYNSLKKL